MFFFLRALWWLLMLPVRLVLFVVGLALWVLVLPLRLVFAVLGLFGPGRLLQLGIIASLGYFFYRLVNDPAPGDGSAPQAG
jgi:hypothetical protein